MLIFLNLSLKRFFLKRYMTFSFVIFVSVVFVFVLFCLCFFFKDVYSRVICKLVLNDILMSFFTV